jgi:peptidoglycan/LPS O-acetylase OafA/YrhL
MAPPTRVIEQSIPLLDESPSTDQGWSKPDGSGRNSTDLGLSFDVKFEREHPSQATVTWPTFLTYLRTIFLQHRRLAGGHLLAALPRYMQPGGLRRKKKLIPSSYLDALRGYAAWVVINRHRFEYADTWLVQQPFFRVLISGRGMVDVFFVISGYVLTYRLLMLTRNQESIMDSLASSTFRRYLRLYGSAGVATFISMLLIRLNWINATERKDTFVEQLCNWMGDFGQFSNPFANVVGFWDLGQLNSRYLIILWTIPVEFRGSLFIFLFCAAACKLSTRHRMTLCWIMVSLCYYWRAIYAALFLFGMFTADLSFSRYPDRLRRGTQLPQQEDDSGVPPFRQSTAARVGYVIMFIVALFLLGQPEDLGREGPFPWQHLSKAIPNWGNIVEEEHFWLSIGAFMLVFALLSSAPETIGLKLLTIPGRHFLWHIYHAPHRYLEPLRSRPNAIT